MFNHPIAYLNTNDGSGILAFGEGELLLGREDDDLNLIDAFIQTNQGKHIFSFLSYDLKNNFYDLTSSHPDYLQLPHFFFWAPKYVVNMKFEHLEFLQGDKNAESLEFISYFLEEETDQNFHHYPFNFKPRISKEVYLEKVKGLKAEIQKGNIYEVNFCQEFYAENVEIKYPFDTYFKLNQITKAPFSSFIQFKDWMIFCGSPERFMKKEGRQLVSQPIKGTIRRGKDVHEDFELKHQLEHDPKERSENTMIVDLTRNDLSKIAKKDTVQVDELCAIYTFETVHQMISSISCELDDQVSFSEILKATFPMGSMTGAPKLRAMELIEQYEDFKRGLYSGSIGYIKPNGNFDFNVVIRSLLYNRANRYISCAVGGAITDLSDPEKEYEECLVKIGKIIDGMQ